MSSQAKHTPGPWRVDPSDPTLIESPSHHVYVASVTTVGIGDRVEANAHLIAAAPEMLEALREMDALVDALWSDVDWKKTFLRGDTIARLNDAPVKAKRAIAKATGQES